MMLIIKWLCVLFVRLIELKLPGTASCWNALEETHQLDKLTLREGMRQMVQYEKGTV